MRGASGGAGIQLVVARRETGDGRSPSDYVSEGMCFGRLPPVGVRDWPASVVSPVVDVRCDVGRATEPPIGGWCVVIHVEGRTVGDGRGTGRARSRS